MGKESVSVSRIDPAAVREKAGEAVRELIEIAGLKRESILVLGCSTSEICGSQIGKGSSLEIGEAVVDGILPFLRGKGIYLAVQGCEHINRSLVIERSAAEKYGFEIVSVVPSLHAGGACAMAAYARAESPVMIEKIVADAGIDIGDTSIGMHVRFVQIPVRLSIREIGGAHVTCLRSRPKLIGGERARYVFEYEGL